MESVSGSAPNFTQPERRSFALPIVLALVALAVAIAIAVHFFPATTIDLYHVHTDVVPTETIFKGSTVIGMSDVDHTLFVVSRIRVVNKKRAPIYIDDFHLTLTEPDGAALEVSGAEKRDLPDLATNFPKLKPLLTQPLVRNQIVDIDKDAEGVVVFPLKVSEQQWNQRKEALIRVDIYQQHPVYATIPK